MTSFIDINYKKIKSALFIDYWARDMEVEVMKVDLLCFKITQRFLVQKFLVCFVNAARAKSCWIEVKV